MATLIEMNHGELPFVAYKEFVKDEYIREDANEVC
jgi:hypothetical protein